jgi:hypothetical protein
MKEKLTMSLTRFGIYSLVIIGRFACKKEENNTPAPTVLYDIIGSVNLYDQGPTAVSDSGMTVAIEGSNPSISAVTDIDGKFTLSEVPKGTYTLTYSKANYGVYKRFDVDHTSNQETIITNNPSLGQKSTTQVTISQANVVNDTLVLTTQTNPAGNVGTSVYLRVLFGKDSNLNPTNFEHFSPVYQSNNSPSVIKFSKQELLSFGFQSGEKVYVEVNGDSFFSNDYFDPTLNRQVFPNLLHSVGVLDFTVP